MAGEPEFEMERSMKGMDKKNRNKKIRRALLLAAAAIWLLRRLGKKRGRKIGRAHV